MGFRVFPSVDATGAKVRLPAPIRQADSSSGGGPNA
jgi:hypothetical protein